MVTYDTYGKLKVILNNKYYIGWISCIEVLYDLF